VRNLLGSVQAMPASRTPQSPPSPRGPSSPARAGAHRQRVPVRGRADRGGRRTRPAKNC